MTLQLALSGKISYEPWMIPDQRIKGSIVVQILTAILELTVTALRQSKVTKQESYIYVSGLYS